MLLLSFRLEVRMTWKSAVVIALAIFMASLAIAPVFAPAPQKLAEEINSQTHKAAALIAASAK